MENKQEFFPVVKAGKDGFVYLCEDPIKIDDKKTDIKDLPTALARMRQKYSTVVYFREAVLPDPDPAYMVFIRKVLDSIAAQKFMIRMGDSYLGQYGEITNFTLHIAPDMFRFGADKGEVMVFAYKPEGEKELKIFKSDLAAEADWRNTIAKDFAMLYHANRLSSTMPSDKEKAFAEGEMGKPSVHISVVINGKHQWASRYPLSAIPGNIKSFMEDCRLLGGRYFLGNK